MAKHAAPTTFTTHVRLFRAALKAAKAKRSAQLEAWGQTNTTPEGAR